MRFSIWGRLKPAWIFESPKDFKIWKVFPTMYDKILCEFRDIDKKIVKFVCLSAGDGSVAWENLRIEEPWWIQIVDTDEDLFFLCKFERPDFPVQGGVYAVDSRSGEILWESDEYNFLFALNGKVYASKSMIDRQIYFEINSRTGEIIRECGEDMNFINELKTAKIENLNFIETSSPFDEYHPDYERVAEVIDEFIKDKDERFQPEILVKQNFLIVNYHTLNKDGKLSNILKVIDIENMKLAYQDVLYDRLSFFISDTFFGKDDFLFYVQNQERLIAIKLPLGHEGSN